MEIKNIIRVCGLFLVIVFGIGVAQSQPVTGDLYGTVSDNQGQVLPGVTVSLSNHEIQVTNAEGRFRFLNLAPGDYELTAELEGFTTVKYPNIEIRVGRETTVEVTLSPAYVEGL